MQQNYREKPQAELKVVNFNSCSIPYANIMKCEWLKNELQNELQVKK